MKRIVLYPRSFVEEISSGFLRMKNLDSICLDAVLIHFPGACRFTHVKRENDEAAILRLTVKKWINTCRSIQRVFCEAHHTHTRPCHPQRQSGCIAKRCSSWTCWSAVPRSRPGGSDISRLASCSRALWSKQNDISLRHVNLSDSRLGKQSRNQQLLTASTYLTTLLDKRWTMKLQHLQTNKISFCQRLSRTWHEYMSRHSTETTAHQALAPSAPMSLYSQSMFMTDLLICSASAKAWRQRQIKVGV